MHLRVAAANRIDYDVVHDARGIAKQRRPVGRAIAAGFGETNVRFVNQRSGVEQCVAAETKT